ncbi:MAG: hypothetical protein M3081_07590 [Gemmatimonadota bacterium]|nr:hypothetical protein [Gemmatimonadota bacterium]
MTSAHNPTHLRFRIGSRGLRVPAVFWLGVAAIAAISPNFPDRRLAIAGGLVLGVGLWILTRPTRVMLDATAQVVIVRTPRMPIGTDTVTIPLTDIVALDVETLPRAFPGDTITFDGYRLTWRLRSGERIPMKRATMVIGAYDKRRAQVNAFLEAHRTA